jgi:hypothetical protein
MYIGEELSVLPSISNEEDESNSPSINSWRYDPDFWHTI